MKLEKGWWREGNIYIKDEFTKEEMECIVKDFEKTDKTHVRVGKPFYITSSGYRLKIIKSPENLFVIKKNEIQNMH